MQAAAAAAGTTKNYYYGLAGISCTLSTCLTFLHCYLGTPYFLLQHSILQISIVEDLYLGSSTGLFVHGCHFAQMKNEGAEV